MKVILREFLEEKFLMQNLRNNRQNSHQPMFLNLAHGHDSEFCKRHITQRTTRLNTKLRRLKTICITYLDLVW